jgi:hypothetical protein
MVILSFLVVIIFVSVMSLPIIDNNIKAESSDVIKKNQTNIANINQSSINTDKVNITMSRSACFGACPVYYIEIHEDGKVIYRGYKNVDVIGEQSSTIPVEKVNELVNQFNHIGYFNLEDRYDELAITDQATVQTSIEIDGIFKSVHDYLGTIEVPELPKLRQLENMIDEVTNSSRWVGFHVLDEDNSINVMTSPS